MLIRPIQLVAGVAHGRAGCAPLSGRGLPSTQGASNSKAPTPGACWSRGRAGVGLTLHILAGVAGPSAGRYSARADSFFAWRLFDRWTRVGVGGSSRAEARGSLRPKGRCSNSEGSQCAST